METRQVWLDGKKKLFFSNKCFQLSAAVAIAAFEIQLFRERLSEKMCTRQSRKVIWDMINTQFLTLQVSNLLLLLSLSTHRHMSMASPAILSNFLEKQCTQKQPTILSWLSRALYPTTFLKIAVYGWKSSGYLILICFSAYGGKIFQKLTVFVFT